MAKRTPITTKELISKLLELDPDGNRAVYVYVAGDPWYNNAVYKHRVEVDDEYGGIVITLDDIDDYETEK